MRLFHGTDNAEIQRPTVLTVGVFDGLHLGHQLIIRTVVERSRAVGAVPTVITFDPHPRAVLHPESAPPLLQTLDQKVEGFGVLGVEQTVVVPFTPEFSMIKAEDFLRQVVKERLQAREVYLGRGFAFGHDREGNIELLRRVSEELGFFADDVPEVRFRNQRVSSSKVRALLAEGKVNLARRLLGRPYGVEGVVERGAQRGHQLGFPTANLHPKNRVIPKNGVYVTGTLIDGKWRRSVTNVGVRPTFGTNTEPIIETFVMDWKGDLYGDAVRVRFLHRLRDEHKFGSIAELKAQIDKDVKRTQSYFEREASRRMLSVV
ncbi:MAG: bifunctional riboflavin kinase/FAD synthetase [Acidobacteriota bacterium]|nr:bifunctional riboflavin kinase/FAD synthetase [Acidobacteriota bacterium]